MPAQDNSLSVQVVRDAYLITGFVMMSLTVMMVAMRINYCVPIGLVLHHSLGVKIKQSVFLQDGDVIGMQIAQMAVMKWNVIHSNVEKMNSDATMGLPLAFPSGGDVMVKMTAKMVLMK